MEMIKTETMKKKKKKKKRKKTINLKVAVVVSLVYRGAVVLAIQMKTRTKNLQI